MTPGRASTRPGRHAIGSALGIGAALFLAICTLFGLALRTGVNPPLAFAAAGALSVLPVLGLRALLTALGSSAERDWAPLASLTATWIWTGALLLALPQFAPGLRQQAARDGAETLLSRFADPLRDPVVWAVAGAAGLLGFDGQGPEPAETPSEPLAVVDPITPTGAASVATTRPPPTRADAPPRDARERVELPYRGDGHALDVEVGLDGPDFGERFRMIFDTGASFTTVTPEALARIDVDIPGDAPRVTLNTAGGTIEAPLVLLDAVWMGNEAIEWVTVAACPSCTAPGRSGLLGLNVSSQFRVEIDYDRKRIHLDPSPGDRRQDIRPWLQLSARGVHHGGERLEFDVTVENRASRAVERASIEIDCGEAGFAVEVGHIPAKGERSTSLEVPGSTRCDSFRLDLISARWVLDRF